MGRKRYSAETKARAAADLLAGMTVREVAAKYEMSQTSVADLSRTSKRGAVYVRKLANLNDLQERFLEQLAHNFGALEAMTGLVMTDPKFAAEQGDKLAILYGVVFDKTGKLAGAAMAGSDMDRQRLGDDPRIEAADDPAPSAASSDAA